jgi:hypothetical protein
MMVASVRLGRVGAGITAFVVALATSATANTVTQNTAWTIDRSGTNTTYRVVADRATIDSGDYGAI